MEKLNDHIADAGKKVRLIDANKAQAVLVNMAEHLLEAGNPEMAGAVGYAAEVIGKQKTVDAVEVVHGRWLSYLDGEHIMPDVYFKCSKCGSRGHQQRWRYCPSCGAKMDGDGNG